MRSRWAAAGLLLAVMLLLPLCPPAFSSDHQATASPAAGQHDPVPESVGDPRTGGDDASLHRLVARSPRAVKASGAPHPAAGAPPTATVRPRSGLPHPPGPRPDGPAPRAADLQTFRC